MDFSNFQKILNFLENFELFRKNQNYQKISKFFRKFQNFQKISKFLKKQNLMKILNRKKKINELLACKDQKQIVDLRTDQPTSRLVESPDRLVTRGYESGVILRLSSYPLHHPLEILYRTKGQYFPFALVPSRLLQKGREGQTFFFT